MENTHYENTPIQIYRLFHLKKKKKKKKLWKFILR